MHIRCKADHVPIIVNDKHREAFRGTMAKRLVQGVAGFKKFILSLGWFQFSNNITTRTQFWHFSRQAFTMRRNTSRFVF
jgi:hypothetical protein